MNWSRISKIYIEKRKLFKQDHFHMIVDTYIVAIIWPMTLV